MAMRRGEQMDAILTIYRDLHDDLSDMIESGRLRERDIPSDYPRLVERLASIAALDPSEGGTRRGEQMDAQPTDQRPVYLLSGGHLSRTVGPDWASPENYVGKLVSDVEDGQ